MMRKGKENLLLQQNAGSCTIDLGSKMFDKLSTLQSNRSNPAKERLADKTKGGKASYNAVGLKMPKKEIFDYKPSTLDQPINLSVFNSQPQHSGGKNAEKPPRQKGLF